MDDWAGFEAVYRDTSVSVLRYLRRRLPRDQAEDALSEVYLTAWRRRAEVRGEPLPWLYGIARMTVANSVRAAGRSVRLHELMVASADERLAAAAEHSALDRMAAAEALDRLPEPAREALLLVAWEGLDVRQAARVMGCSRAAFSVRLHRARKLLDRALAESATDEVGEEEREEEKEEGAADGTGRGKGAGAAVGSRSGGRRQQGRARA
ncbi:sigma-70 family RNA polymerase sigma factor [Streptomyces sp. HNM0663]|uniref:Sigma-70 family RNA polymerase sigma factor n=1 Tax=Streptomyces chengmaiensis TaxID=3040919 RepID=A0ABT6HHP7_9ACTN|nr:sigma-70 family RNA polymerase sigma factor [Streptomyces chengmaiensis]MDH2387805.1 sigma-70 family RNA polymerase sigma factor [Streptomyces chengmaiensis]